MGNEFSWRLERDACDWRISSLCGELSAWEAEEAALRQFLQAVRATAADLEGRDRTALQAAEDMSEMEKICLTAGICGRETAGALRHTGCSQAESAIRKLENGAVRELSAYADKMESAENEIRELNARREWLVQRIGDH